MDHKKLAWVITGMILINGLRDNKDAGRDTKNKRRESSDKKGHRNIAKGGEGGKSADMFRIRCNAGREQLEMVEWLS